MSHFRSLVRMMRQAASPAVSSNNNEIAMFYKDTGVKFLDPVVAGDVTLLDNWVNPARTLGLASLPVTADATPDSMPDGVTACYPTGTAWPDSADQGALLVVKANGRVLQIFASVSSTPYFRTGTGTTWKAWQQYSLTGHTHAYADIPGLQADLSAAGVGDSVSYTITPVSPFSGSPSVIVSGKRATVSGGFTRSSGSSSSFVQCGTIPVGARPSVDVLLPAAPIFGQTIQYQYSILTTGVIQIRMSGANSLTLAFGGASWMIG